MNYFMQVTDLIGTYTIKGTNQSEGESSYQGILHLSLDENNRVVAEWQIGEHLQFGQGFFKDDILVVYFKYNGEGDEILKGIVVYKCITSDYLEGFWSEKYGDPKYLGSEKCYRIHTNIEA